MHLRALDWIIIAVTLLICFVPALIFGKRGSKDTSEFFVSGRAVPWWLAGLSMVATTFASDTPNLVTNIVRTQGVAGNWQWWAFALTGLATVFFYARMWRRSNVMTDLEFYELRYSGQAARLVRGFRSVYLGLLFNCLILATVSLAACKIAAILFGIPQWETLLVLGVVNVICATYAGLWGVLVIDMFQFFVKMTAAIAAAYFAVEYVGGLHVMVQRLSGPMLAPDGKHWLHYLNILPDFSNNWDIAVAVFIMPIAVQWWASWYPGAEPGGGSYIAQRMLASKSEKDSLGAVLFFNIAHYIVRPWPWILVGLCSLIVYPHLSDIQTAFPHLDPKLLGDDIAYPAMLKFLPVGFMGLMVGGLIAANSSTVLSHLNWGASYLVHDFYQRFIKTDASEQHYVMVGRLATVGLYIAAAGLTFVLGTAKDAFNIIIQVGAGTGLLYLARWFWWRINAWSEVMAMISSFITSVALIIVQKSHPDLIPGIPPTDAALIVTVVVTTICWVLTAYFGPKTDTETLIAFYKKVKPFGPGWNAIAKAVGTSEQATESQTHESIPLCMVGWLAGCMLIWSALIGIGDLLYGNLKAACAVLAVTLVCTVVLVQVVRLLWRTNSQAEDQ